jgi:hypothetical protein
MIYSSNGPSSRTCHNAVFRVRALPTSAKRETKKQRRASNEESTPFLFSFRASAGIVGALNEKG